MNQRKKKKMSKRSVKKRVRKTGVEITFKGSVAAGQEKAKLTKLIKKVPELMTPPAIEVYEDDTDHGEALHVHDESCSHTG